MQQRFWPDPQPLVERLGRSFFRQLPERPGVYLMQSAGEIVLYVGKAKSLRHRLGSYRVANPDRMPRRILRLLRLVERITWEECADEPAALRREAELLLALRPRFNRAGVWPGPKRFLAWRTRPEGLELAVTPVVDAGWHGAGPFGGRVIPLHRTLVRLFWCRFQPARGLSAMPSGWFRGVAGSCLTIPHSHPDLAAEAALRLHDFFRTGPGALEHWLLPPAVAFDQACWQEDFSWLLGRGEPA